MSNFYGYPTKYVGPDNSTIKVPQNDTPEQIVKEIDYFRGLAVKEIFDEMSNIMKCSVCGKCSFCGFSVRCTHRDSMRCNRCRYEGLQTAAEKFPISVKDDFTKCRNCGCFNPTGDEL